MIPTINTYKEAKTISDETLIDLKKNKEWFPKGAKTYLLLMSIQGIAASKGVSSVHEPGFKYGVATYDDMYMRWSYDPRDFKAISEALLLNIKKASDWYKPFLELFYSSTKTLKDTSDSIFFDVTWAPKDIETIMKIAEDLMNKAIIPQSYGYLTEIFTYTNDYWVTRYIKEIQSDISEEDLQILLQPSTKSFTQEFSEKLHDAKTDSDFENIIKTFYWVKGSYFSQPTLTLGLLKEEQVKLNFQDTLLESKKKKVEILKKLNNSELNNFIKVVESFIAMQDERKANVLRTNYALRKIVDAVGNILKVPTEVLLSTTPREFLSITNSNIDPEISVRIAERNQESVWLFGNDGYCITTDKILKKELQNLLKEELQKNLKGYTASKGKVSGVVKIVLSEQDFSKIENGDILVTSMTRPEFMPVLQKAAAFITNEGGITCHAAIVSRELKKPCIIGTKIATQVLKDGMEVEVDADNGIVRIIK